MKSFRRRPIDTTDRAVIARQRELLADQAETIRALGVELEATRALADSPVTVRETFLLERARWYRDLAHHYKRQAELGLEILQDLKGLLS